MREDIRNDPELKEDEQDDERERLTEEGIDAAEQWRGEQE